LPQFETCKMPFVCGSFFIIHRHAFFEKAKLMVFISLWQLL
jgi:hypothetical protein